MKTHGISRPLRVKDSSVAAGILENVCGSGEDFFVGRKKGLAGFEALVIQYTIRFAKAELKNENSIQSQAA